MSFVATATLAAAVAVPPPGAPLIQSSTEPTVHARADVPRELSAAVSPGFFGRDPRTDCCDAPLRDEAGGGGGGGERDT